MSIDPGGQVVNFDVGIYKGDLNDQGVAHGHGRLDYKVDDILSRKYYEGQWSLGKNTGQGRLDVSGLTMTYNDYEPRCRNGCRMFF